MAPDDTGKAENSSDTAGRGVKRGAFPTSEADLAAADRYVPDGDTADESPENGRPSPGDG